MNDPRSSNGRGGAAKQATTTVSDLGTEQGEWKDLGEVSRGQQSISFIYEGHEKTEKILRKIGRDRLPLPWSYGGDVMGSLCEQA